MGDPSIVFVMFAFSKLLQNPKSPNFTIPLLKKILSGFRSRCMILYLFNTWKASSNCLKINKAFFYCSALSFLRTPYNVPPLQNSYTK
jgi:hypothetical protein